MCVRLSWLLSAFETHVKILQSAYHIITCMSLSEHGDCLVQRPCLFLLLHHCIIVTERRTDWSIDWSIDSSMFAVFVPEVCVDFLTPVWVWIYGPLCHRLKDTNVIVSCYHAATTTTAARPFMTTGGVCLLFVCSSCPMIGRVTRSRPVLQRTDFAGRSRSTDNRRHLTNISAINSANPATWTRWTSRQEEGRQTGWNETGKTLLCRRGAKQNNRPAAMFEMKCKLVGFNDW